MKFNLKVNAHSSTKLKEIFATTDFKNVDAAIKEASRHLCFQGNRAEIWNTTGTIVHTIEHKTGANHALLGKGFFQSHYPQELLQG